MIVDKTSPFFAPEVESLDAEGIRAHQRAKLAQMLTELRAKNPFYRRKLGAISFHPEHDPIELLPFTTRAELEADQVANPPYGTNLT